MALPAPPTPATAGRAAVSGWATHPADRRSALLPLHESTTRYDHDPKLLSFLLVCRVGGIENLVHRLRTNPLRASSRPWALGREAIGFAGQQQPNAPDQAGTRWESELGSALASSRRERMWS